MTIPGCRDGDRVFHPEDAETTKQTRTACGVHVKSPEGGTHGEERCSC